MTWLSDQEWKRVQENIPIVVVDIVLLSADEPPRVGLIQRNTPHQGVRWNLVGGRIRYGESIAEALIREASENLGRAFRIVLGDVSTPQYVAQYAPDQRQGFLPDPRKHAVALTYALPATGPIEPTREALGFEWFRMNELPAREDWGFQQDRAAEACLRNAGFRPGFSVA